MYDLTRSINWELLANKFNSYMLLSSSYYFLFAATKGRSKKVNFTQSKHGQRLGQASQLRLIREFGVFEFSFHSGDQCLCRTINQTSLFTLSEPVVHTSK